MRARTVGCLFASLALLVLVAQPAAADPPPPVILVTAAAPSPGTVVLTWPASAGATSYRVYRDEDLLVQSNGFVWALGPNAALAGTSTSTTFTDTARPPLVRQFYTVTAVNADGEQLNLGIVPALARVYPTAAPDAAVHGFADTHNHQFANLGFGGNMLFGEAFHTHVAADGTASDAEVALRWCNEAHGLGGIDDVVGNFLHGRFGHNTSGYSGFAGWPRYNDSTHQQVYVDWLYRAFEGGLKLLVVHAVNNELLCVVDGALGFGNRFPCDDMSAADRQIQAAKDMQAYVDAQSGGAGKGWYRVATSASAARAIINSGKLAVVLGIEVDKLFGCGTGGCPVASGQTPEQYVTAKLDAYYAAGVRHLFPVHVFDNAFGGVALYNPLFNYGNRLANGSYFGVKDCGAAYGYKSQVDPALATLLTFLNLGAPASTAFVSECNSRGLTSLGDTLVTGMMNRGMMIDLDHMSKDTFDAVLAKAEARSYSGVVTGHTTLLKVLAGQKRIEGARTDDSVTRIGALGGLVSPILEQGPRSTSAHLDGITQLPNAPIANDCGSSSKTFAQAYLAAIRFLGGRSVAAVGLGSDFNGLAGEPGPRFGSEACPGDASAGAQSGGVSYPFAIVPPPGVTDAGTLGRAFAGSRVFDFNVDGLAHVGLLPDLIADMRSAGAFPQDLEPLFRSAEQYLLAWELAEANGKPLPTVTLTASPVVPPTGWFTAAPAAVAMGSVAAGAPALNGILMTASGAQFLDETLTSGPSASLSIVADGVTDVTARARDRVGRLSAVATLAVRLDTVAPTVACEPADGLWHAGAVSIPCTAADGTSGLADPADALFALSADVAAGTESASVSTDSRAVQDVAGWSTTAGPVGGNKIDRKAPAISIVVPTAAVLIGSVVPADFSCLDGGSGVATCIGTTADGDPLPTATAGVKSLGVTASDSVGNTSASSAAYTVAYNLCLLYDQTKVKKVGSTVPVKLQVCDVAGQNLSSPAVTLTATGTVRVSTATAGPLDDAGQANPDFNFRYDPALAGYIFNLKTTGLSNGTWHLRFTVGTDPYQYSAEFQLR